MLAEEYDVPAWYLLPLGQYEQGPTRAGDGWPLDKIQKARHEACTFISRLGQHLKLYWSIV